MTTYHVTSRMLGDDLVAMLGDHRLLPCAAPGPEDTGCTRLAGHPGMHAAGTTLARPATGDLSVVISAAWDQPDQTNRKGHDDHE